MATVDSTAIPLNVKDRTGQRFGRLVAIHYVGLNGFGQALWLCQCDCGNTHTAVIRKNRHQGCGCIQREAVTTHGGSGTPTFRTWSHMLSRCYTATHHAFADYGGRGISVCQGWRGAFQAFLTDMGERPAGMTLDRIDNDGNYSCGHCEECVANNWPANCRWATRSEQARNRRCNRLLTFNGTTMSLAEWSELQGIPETTISGRLAHGWTTERALTVRDGRSPLITFRGKTQTRCEWARELSIPPTVIADRFRLGWSVELAFTEPVRHRQPPL